MDRFKEIERLRSGARRRTVHALPAQTVIAIQACAAGRSAGTFDTAGQPSG